MRDPRTIQDALDGRPSYVTQVRICFIQDPLRYFLYSKFPILRGLRGVEICLRNHKDRQKTIRSVSLHVHLTSHDPLLRDADDVHRHSPDLSALLEDDRLVALTVSVFKRGKYGQHDPSATVSWKYSPTAKQFLPLEQEKDSASSRLCWFHPQVLPKEQSV